MSSLLTEVENYKEKIGRCVDNATNIILAYKSINQAFDSYKIQIFNIKLALLRGPFDINNFVDLRNQLSYLENSALSLANLADFARQTALGQLGLNLDELRSVNDFLYEQTIRESQLSNSSLIRPTLENCKHAIEDTCKKLIDCCAIDEGILKNLLKPQKH